MIRKFYDGLATLGGGETTKGAGEIPEAIQKWIEKEAMEMSGGKDYGKRISIITSLQSFYHHLTTSSPSNSGGKVVSEQIRSYESMIKNLEWHVKTNDPQGHLLQEAALQINCYREFVDVLKTIDALSSQFPQPQLVSGVRTKLKEAQYDLKNIQYNMATSNESCLKTKLAFKLRSVMASAGAYEQGVYTPMLDEIAECLSLLNNEQGVQENNKNENR